MQGGCVKMLKITAKGFIDSHLIAYKISLDLFLRLEILPSLDIILFLLWVSYTPTLSC